MEDKYFKGRGAQFNTRNSFLKNEYVFEHIEGLDEEYMERPRTQIFYESPQNIVNKVESPDLRFSWSMNPYQGCEHGCIYCYARNVHEYWGFSAGIDFETKIIVKPEAPQLLEKFFNRPSWKATPIMLSGNTDCYQPLERKFQITRNILKVFAKYGNPVGIVTKNSLILRDLDVLKDLSSEGLVHVFLSVNSLDENLRRIMEPRTASAKKRIETIARLSEAGVPSGVMVAPIIPALNSKDIVRIVEKASKAGALAAAMTVVRLNGAIKHLFKDWLEKNFPERFNKVWHQIEHLHNGQVNDSEWGRRMRGEGPISDAIVSMFKTAVKHHFKGRVLPPLNVDRFRKGGTLNLF
ncbi:PA0069 family radical SAM protein [Fulvivirgaceae bacterium BMA10]|uniref:PA0069 family radical SAM protein n=1 Tax=Splendidivirga corallicola TaxID=3051826 RepID=A0ABT8KUK0_9BACT|nr:PA0069 family radical SAM protein [Fulvivirgaceae bacterium BMA10]